MKRKQCTGRNKGWYFTYRKPCRTYAIFRRDDNGVLYGYAYGGKWDRSEVYVSRQISIMDDLPDGAFIVRVGKEHKDIEITAIGDIPHKHFDITHGSYNKNAKFIDLTLKRNDDEN